MLDRSFGHGGLARLDVAGAALLHRRARGARVQRLRRARPGALEQQEGYVRDERELGGIGNGG